MKSVEKACQPQVSLCMSPLCIFGFCILFTRKPLPQVEAVLWVSGLMKEAWLMKDHCLLLVFLLSDPQPCVWGLPSNCILDLPSINKDRVECYQRVLQLNCLLLSHHQQQQQRGKGNVCSLVDYVSFRTWGLKWSFTEDNQHLTLGC